jgi:Mn-dependent DtxR family transcriptional regulator
MRRCSIAAGRLKSEKLIEYKRGEITTLDRKGLEARACECYQIIRKHLSEFASFDTANTA